MINDEIRCFRCLSYLKKDSEVYAMKTLIKKNEQMKSETVLLDQIEYFI